MNLPQEPRHQTSNPNVIKIEVQLSLGIQLLQRIHMLLQPVIIPCNKSCEDGWITNLKVEDNLAHGITQKPSFCNVPCYCRRETEENYHKVSQGEIHDKIVGYFKPKNKGKLIKVYLKFRKSPIYLPTKFANINQIALQVCNVKCQIYNKHFYTNIKSHFF